MQTAFSAILLLLTLTVAVPAIAEPEVTIPALRYDAETRVPVPIPAAERGLQTIVAKPWTNITQEDSPLEGPSFDRNGDLLLTDVGSGRILRLGLDGKSSVVLDRPGIGIGGLAVHKDGRIFVAAAGDFKVGQIGYVDSSGGEWRVVVPLSAGYAPNDLVFDRKGGFYFTDFRGSTTELAGGVYYVSPDMKTTTKVIGKLARANGVALSPDGQTLWVDEFAANRLIRIELKNSTTPADLGMLVAYNFVGPAPDSMRVDRDGNLYVALFGQGRVMVFSPSGIPIGQILLPGREAGHNLQSTSMALRPDTDEIYIVSNDGRGGAGATVFVARAFAKALPLYSHQTR